MALPSRHLQTLVALALDRAAFSRPGPDGRMQPSALADVEAILQQIGGHPGRGAALPYAFDPNEPRDEDGQWAADGAGAAGEDEDEEDDLEEPEDPEADLRQEWDDYDAELASWQIYHDEAHAEYREARAAWEQATATHEAWKKAHDEWDDREQDRDRKKEAIDEADPVADADLQADKVFAELSSPLWDAGQPELATQFLAEADAVIAARLSQWDQAFGMDSLARQALAGTDAKLLARWDKLTSKGRDKLARQGEKFRTATRKYAAFQESLELEQKAHEESEPEEPEEPDLDKPGAHEFDTDEEYQEAQAEYTEAWALHATAQVEYEKASAAWEKEGKSLDKMESAAARLAEKVDDEESDLVTTWDDQRDYLTEAQDDIKNTLAEHIDTQAEQDPEPDEPEEPGDEPDEPDLDDPPEEPDMPRPSDPHARKSGPLSYAAVPPASPLKLGLIEMAQGVIEFLSQPPPPTIIHMQMATPKIVVQVPEPAENSLAYQRDVDLQATLNALAQALTQLVAAQSRPPPEAPVIQIPTQPAPVVHVAPAAVEVKVQMPELRRRKVRVLRDDEGEIVGSVEE